MEQEKILTTAVDNSKAQGNRSWNTDGGNNTQDKVFLLSYGEAWKYFYNDVLRQCQPTEYAVSHGAFKGNNSNCNWWLRSSGSDQNYAAVIRIDGSCNHSFVSNGSTAVRPAIWVDLSSGIF